MGLLDITKAKGLKNFEYHERLTMPPMPSYEDDQDDPPIKKLMMKTPKAKKVKKPRSAIYHKIYTSRWEEDYIKEQLSRYSEIDEEKNGDTKS